MKREINKRLVEQIYNLYANEPELFQNSLIDEKYEAVLQTFREYGSTEDLVEEIAGMLVEIMYYTFFDAADLIAAVALGVC